MTDYPNWFAQTAQHNFEKHLLPLAGQPLHCLQLGAYTGDASVWLATNVLTDSNCFLMDVDTWKGSDEPDHKTMDFDDVRKTYLSKVIPFPVIESYIGTTMDFLSEFRDHNCYDFIYIDADHTTVGVIVDAELSWPKLKRGGIMAFDDYTWQHESGDPRLAPQVGIDLFLHRHQGEYELLAKNTQVWIRKH
jgi:predicted O-methyltransferase YrrM